METVIFATNGELCKEDCKGLCSKCLTELVRLVASTKARKLLRLKLNLV